MSVDIPARKRKYFTMAKRVPGLTPAMSKAARALLGLSQEEMAEAIKISISTVRRFEAGASMSPANEAKLIDLFEKSGLILVYSGKQVIGLVESGQDDQGAKE
jgi:DNA-binding transcriptional regulator YiaG